MCWTLIKTKRTDFESIDGKFTKLGKTQQLFRRVELYRTVNTVFDSNENVLIFVLNSYRISRAFRKLAIPVVFCISIFFFFHVLHFKRINPGGFARRSTRSTRFNTKQTVRGAVVIRVPRVKRSAAVQREPVEFAFDSHVPPRAHAFFLLPCPPAACSWVLVLGFPSREWWMACIVV